MSSIYLDFNKIYSFDAFLNLLITERGIGKTYGITMHVVDDFLKNKNQFILIRRYKSELKKAVSTFFREIAKNEKYKDVKFSVSGNTLYINGEVAGFGVTLSTAQDLKSSNYPQVKTIIFDEFIIEEGQKKYYLQNEVMVFLNLIETIRKNEKQHKNFYVSKCR